MTRSEGTYYELAMQLPRERVRDAFDALWTAPQIVARDDSEPRRGTIRTPLGDVPCLSWIIEDWLDLSLPTSALTARGLTYEVYDSPREVLDALDSTLVSLAVRVFAAAPFHLGLIGEEVSGLWTVDEAPHEIVLRENLLLPEPLWTRLGSPPATPIAPGLVWKQRSVTNR